MGMFVNPDNLAFQAALNARIYVDKSGILNYTNSVLGSTDAFICNSRPRRFGKSVTANMLTAYYSKGCDSEEMFSRLEISQAEDFRKHLNQYDVIHWDIQWCMDNETVAAQIEKIHNEYASVIRYHDENSLSSVLAIAYLGTMQYYFKPVREFPTGRGFADFIFIPKPEYKSAYPALVVELKWNQKVQTAIQQIKDRKYPSSISDYTGDILLVGINYDKKSKKHQCIIEKV